MYSLLVTVVLLATAANNVKVREQQGTGGWGGSVSVGMYMVPLPTGAQVPKTSNTCTQPNLAGFLDYG